METDTTDKPNTPASGLHELVRQGYPLHIQMEERAKKAREIAEKLGVSVGRVYAEWSIASERQKKWFETLNALGHQPNEDPYTFFKRINSMTNETSPSTPNRSSKSMNQNQTKPKPQDVEEPREEGLHEPTCSASFTPGPWHCESSLGLVRSAADQRIVCAMPHALNKRAIKMRKPGDDAEITPDAILIAAAPNMLAALKIAKDEFERRDGAGTCPSEIEDLLEEILGQNAKGDAPT